jgi:hypothetical protein
MRDMQMSSCRTRLESVAGETEMARRKTSANKLVFLIFGKSVHEYSVDEAFVGMRKLQMPTLNLITFTFICGTELN